MSAKFSHETKRERESEHSSMYITIFILHPSVGNRAADRKKKKKKKGRNVRSGEVGALPVY